MNGDRGDMYLGRKSYNYKSQNNYDYCAIESDNISKNNFSYLTKMILEYLVISRGFGIAFNYFFG
jgi:hypothetical protein